MPQHTGKRRFPACLRRPRNPCYVFPITLHGSRHVRIGLTLYWVIVHIQYRAVIFDAVRVRELRRERAVEMEWVVKTGSSVEAALQAALAELGIQRGEAEFEVVQEAQKGLFGFLGGQEAIVKVRPIPQTASFASDFVQEVTRQLGVTVDVETRRENGYVFCDVFGKNVGLLIDRGQTLDALQYLVNVAGSRHCPGMSE